MTISHFRWLPRFFPNLAILLSSVDIGRVSGWAALGWVGTDTQYYSAGRNGHQIHPFRVERIDSVKINPSLVMMREWEIHPLRLRYFPRPWVLPKPKTKNQNPRPRKISRISLEPQDFPRALPSGNLLGVLLHLISNNCDSLGPNIGF